MKKLSRKEIELRRKALVLPKTNKEFFNYVKDVFGLRIPYVKMCENHTTPFQFFSDIFFERVKSAIGMANRGGMKTTGIAAIHAMNCKFKKGCNTGTAGAIQRQADQCYDYFKKFIRIYEELGLVEYTQAKKTKFRPPLESIVEILIATKTGMNGPHPVKTFLDEVDLVEWTIYQEYLGMGMGAKQIGEEVGLEAQNILTSTRKTHTGTMQQILDEENNAGYKLYAWCIFEVVERCTRKSCDECKSIIKGRYPDKYHDKELRGQPRSFYSVCRERIKKANGYYSLSDMITKFTQTDIITWEAQYECRKPTIGGNVFYWFDRATCVKKKDFNPNGRKELKFYNSIDFGGSDPNVCQFWLEEDGNFYMFDEIYEREMAPSEFARHIKRKREEYGIADERFQTFCDRSGKSSILQLENEGIDAIGSINDILEGVNIVNSLGYSGQITMHPRCENAAKEYGLYAWPKGGGTKPDKKHSHSPDATRYLFLSINPLNSDLSAIKDDTSERESEYLDVKNKILNQGEFSFRNSKLFDGEGTSSIDNIGNFLHKSGQRFFNIAISDDF